MKKIVVLLLTGLLVCMAGCGEKEATESGKENDNSSKVEVTEEADREEEQDDTEKDDQVEQETNETVESLMENTTGLFGEDDLVGELPFGYEKDGVPMVAGYIKISAEGTLAADGWGENNEFTSLAGGDFTIDCLKDNLNKKNIFNVMSSETSDHELHISIDTESVGDKQVYLKSYQADFPDGVMIEDTVYPAYGYYENFQEEDYFTVIIPLDEEHVLGMVYSGEKLHEEPGTGELVHRLYNLFTPAE